MSSIGLHNMHWHQSQDSFPLPFCFWWWAWRWKGMRMNVRGKRKWEMELQQEAEERERERERERTRERKTNTLIRWLLFWFSSELRPQRHHGLSLLPSLHLLISSSSPSPPPLSPPSVWSSGVYGDDWEVIRLVSWTFLLCADCCNYVAERISQAKASCVSGTTSWRGHTCPVTRVHLSIRTHTHNKLQIYQQHSQAYTHTLDTTRHKHTLTTYKHICLYSHLILCIKHRNTLTHPTTHTLREVHNIFDWCAWS